MALLRMNESSTWLRLPPCSGHLVARTGVQTAMRYVDCLSLDPVVRPLSSSMVDHRLSAVHNPEGSCKMENLRRLLFALTASLALGCSGNGSPPSSGPQGGGGSTGGIAGASGGVTAAGGGGVTSVPIGGSSVTGGSSAIGGSTSETGGAGKGGATGDLGGTTAKGGTTADLGGSTAKGGTTADLGGSTAKGGTTGDLGGTTAKGGATGDLGGTTAKGGTTGNIGGTTAKGGTTGDLGGTTANGGTTGNIGGTTGGTTGTGGKGGAGGSAGGGSGSGGAVTFPDAGPVDPNQKITIWMVGDSTMQNCSGSAGQCGWAAEFQQYCGPNATVSNQARGGRSISTWIWGDPNVSKTATDASGECQIIDNKTYSTNWTDMLDATKGMKPGDWVYIAFGINDGSGGCNRHVGSALYQSDLAYLATQIRAKGAYPIFGTPTSGQKCSGSTNVANRGFGPETKAAGTASNVPVIDLTQLSVDLYNSLKLCPGGSSTFWADGTHFKTEGATQVAGVVAKAIKDQGIGLAVYLK
jgi:lysophospholipase L1-like esterase